MKRLKTFLLLGAALSASFLVVVSRQTNVLAELGTHSAALTADHLVAQSQPVAMATGTFVAAEQPTAGTARIVTENGKHYLEIDSAFSTSDRGPDLHVLLDTTQTPPMSYDAAQEGRYINLGALKAFKGAQRYPIPDVVDPTAYSSVVVWCRMANATFGYAALASSNPVSVQ